MAKLLSNTRVYGTATVDTQLFVQGSNSAHSTNTGALQVLGGIGVAGSGFFSGTVTATNFVGLISGTAQSANNVVGGTAGQLVYQSAPSTTAFAGPGTAGQILTSGGTGAPVYVNTATFAVGLSKNLLGGSAGQFAYQTAANSTDFVSTASMYVGRAVLADSVVGNSVGTATNLAGGTAGQVPYQTGPGATGFYGPGTAGQLLVSAGAAAPVYTNTASVFVGNATLATDLRGGSAGQIVFQSNTNDTDFVGPGTAGQVLTSNGTAGPVYVNTGSLYVGRATVADTVVGGTGFVNSEQQTANAPYYLLFVDANNAVATAENVFTTSTFVVNPSTGFIGLGTATPSDRLELSAAANAARIRLTNTTAGRSSILGQDASGFYYQPTSSSDLFQLRNDVGTAQFTYNPNTSYIGIGTTGPSEKLHVDGGTGDTRIRVSADDGTNYRGFEVRAGATFKGGLLYRTNEGDVLQVWGPNVSSNAIQIDANNMVSVRATTSTHSTNTGALQVSGGIGVAGSGFFGGVVTATTFVGSVTGSISGNAATVSTQRSTSTATHFLTFVDANNASATAETVLTTSSVVVTPSTGFVGIGTNTVGFPLTVVSSDLTAGEVHLASFHPSTRGDGSVSIGYVSTGTNDSYGFVRSRHSVDFGLGAGQPNHVFIKQSGNVGIGTTSPAGLFSVATASGSGSTVTAWGSGHAIFGPNVGSTTGAALGLTYNTTGDRAEILSLAPNVAWKPLWLYSSGLEIYAAGAGHAMSVTTGGLVGIGTTTPGGKLTISGNTTAALLVNTTSANDNSQDYLSVFRMPGTSFAGGGLMITSNQSANAGKAFLSIMNYDTSDGTNIKPAAYLTTFTTRSHATRQNPNGSTVSQIQIAAANLSLTNHNLYMQQVGFNSTSNDYINSHAYMYMQTSGGTTRINAYTGYRSTGQFAVGGESVGTFTDFHAQDIGSSGTIATRYGLLIDFSSSGVTNPWGIYQSQSTTQNYFAGNVGIGVTPSAWGSGVKVVQVNYGALVSSLTNNTLVTSNCYYDGTQWIYLDTAAATIYTQNSGGHTWRTAGSGTAGNTISFTQAMILDASGNLGIGATSPSYRLDAQGSGSVYLRALSSSSGQYAGVLLANSGASGQTWEIGVGGNTTPATYANNLYFYGNGSPRMIITPSGLVGIGTASPYNARLHVAGNTTSPDLSSAVVSNASAVLGNSDLEYGTYFATYGSGSGAIQQRRGGSAVYYDLYLQPHGGNVGVGTTSPGSTLDIFGLQTNSSGSSASNPTGTLRLSFAGAPNLNEYGASLVFSQYWWTGSTSHIGVGQITGVKTTGNGNFGGGLAFWTSNGSNNNLTERMRIDHVGNLGIGTASPGYKLEIGSGLVKVADGITNWSNSGTKYYTHLCTGNFYNAVGAVVINTNIPGHNQSGNGNMFSFRITGYCYDNVNQGAIDMVVGCYAGEGNFFNPTVTGTIPSAWVGNISFYTNPSGKVAVVLGTTSTTQLCVIAVSDFVQSFSNVLTTYAQGWTTTSVTSLSGYTNPIAPLYRTVAPRIVGNVAIGTTTDPTSGGFTNSTLLIKQVDNGVSGGGLQIEQNGSDRVAFFGFTGSAFRIGTSYRTSGTYQGIEFWTNGSTRASLTTDGFFGIGTTSPSGLLHVANLTLNNSAYQHVQFLSVNNNTEASGESYTSSAPSFGIAFRRQWSSSTFTNLAGIYGFGSTNWRGGLLFRTKNNTTSTGEPDIDALYLSPAGNVGVGTTNPQHLFVVSNGGAQGFEFIPSGGILQLYNRSTSAYGNLRFDASQLLFFTGTPTERMRINADGAVLIGRTTTYTGSSDRFVVDGGISAFTRDSGYPMYVNRNTTTGILIEFSYAGIGGKGNISTDGTNVAYNTSSDRRLKLNIQPAGSAGNIIDNIEIVEHDWVTGMHTRYGVVAQDLYEVVPEAVKVGDNEQQIKETWGVDYSKLVPILVKEIQELRARVAALEDQNK